MALLTVFLVLLFALPARLVVPGFGAAGRPADLWGLGLLGLAALVWLHSQPREPSARRSRVFVAAGLWFAVVLLIFGLGHARGLPMQEFTSADRALLKASSWLGVAVTVAQLNRRDLERLLQRTVVGGVLLALVGWVQFFLQFDPVPFIRPPGLVLNDANLVLGVRGAPGFARVGGTALHYIEYGVVLAMLFPIAVHNFLNAKAAWARRTAFICLMVIAVGIPLSISRSAVLVLVVTCVLMASIWPLRWIVNAAALGLLGLVALQVLVSGLLGTIRALFRNVGNDPSIEGRTKDYEVISAYIADRPVFGRGLGTFTPERYILLDNEFLMILGAGGFVLLAAWLILYAGAYGAARRTSARSQGRDRHLAQVVAASIAGSFVSLATFDGFSFPTFASLTFLLFGAAAALERTGEGSSSDEAQPAGAFRL